MKILQTIGFRNGMSTRAAIAIWTLFCALYFAPVLPRSKVLAPLDILETLERPWAKTDQPSVKNAHCYDAISQYIPYDWSVYKSLREDGYVGWNPDVHGGTAIRENHMLCPSSLRHVFYRFLPFWDAWDWGRITHYFLAGLGMILLLLEAGLPAWGALLGAVSFSFSSQMIVWVHSDVIASGCCWSPWMLWSLFRLKRSVIEAPPTLKDNRKRMRSVFWTLAAGCLIGVALRAGFLHTMLFNGTLLSLFFLSEFPEFRKTPREGRRVWVFYLLASGVGLLILLPWLLAVVPPAIRGGHALRPHSILAGLKAIPTLVTSMLPTALGAPDTLDASKLFGEEFLNIKFAGGTVFCLAFVACLQRGAPVLPKLLAVLFLAIPFTPLAKWYYSRCFVLGALGMAWLAAWQLNQHTNLPKTRFWHHVLRLFCGACLIWILVSIILQFAEPRLLPTLQNISVRQLPPNKASRADWTMQRAAAFYHQCLIWSQTNLLSLAALGIGLFASASIRKGNPRNRLLLATVILATFSEMLLFGSHIMYAADRPEPKDDAPYPDREWIARFKAHLTNGSVVFWQNADSRDFDYMQINAPSAHGIRQAEGYESVQPVRLAPKTPNAFNPTDFAQAGISHVSTPHGEPFPNAEAWRLVEASPDYDLYENPDFRSIFLARLADGSEVPLFADLQTPNSFHLTLPANAISVRLAMTYHPAWRYRLGDNPWLSIPPSSDGLRASQITFPHSLPADTELRLRFH